MKFSIIACIVFLFIGFKSLADCGGGGLSAFPKQKNIPKSSLFVLDGYAHSQTTIQKLGTEYPVYLQSGTEKILLKVLETQVGKLEVSQALLKPEKPLTPGKEYQLIVENVTDESTVMRNNPDGSAVGMNSKDIQKTVVATYYVMDESDIESPEWIKIPAEKDKELHHFGCGPSIHVNFKLEVSESAAYLIKTTLKSVETGKETTFYIVEKEGVLSIGHGMCAGAFNFNDGTNYQAKFQIMDSSGNVSEETEWVTFTKPLD